MQIKKTLKHTLCALTAAAFIGLSGCSKSEPEVKPQEPVKVEQKKPIYDFLKEREYDLSFEIDEEYISLSYDNVSASLSVILPDKTHIFYSDGFFENIDFKIEEVRISKDEDQRTYSEGPILEAAQKKFEAYLNLVAPIIKEWEEKSEARIYNFAKEYFKIE